MVASISISVDNQLLILMAAVVKIKLFQNVQRFYYWLGIYPPFFNRNHSMNRRNVYLLLGTAPMICSTAGFLIFDQNASAVDRVQTFYVFLTHIACVVNFLASFAKRASIFSYIEKFEKHIEKRKPLSIIMLKLRISVNRMSIAQCPLTFVLHQERKVIQL